MSTDFEVMVPPEAADSGATQKGMLSATAAANSGQVNAALAYLATLHSPQSRKSVASKLNVFARWTGAADLRDCRWGEMKTEHVLAFLANQERDGISGSTSNCYLAALKGVAQAAWLARSMEHEDYLRIKSLKQRRFYRLPTGRALSFDESRNLLAGCDADTAIGARDRAVISLMLGCGLRRGEIPGIRIDKLDLYNRSLTLIGKGDKERRVFLPPPVAQAVEIWIRSWRGTEPGLLFGRIYKNGRISITDALDPSSIGRITKRRMESANHESATAHDLRRTFATRLFANNVDIMTVKNMMGHSNISTTAMYDRRGDDAMRRAAENAVL